MTTTNDITESFDVTQTRDRLLRDLFGLFDRTERNASKLVPEDRSAVARMVQAMRDAVSRAEASADQDEDFSDRESALSDRLFRFHHVLHRSAHFADLILAGKGGCMVVHGTSVEIGEDYRASLDDVALHADRLDEKYGDWDDGPYPTI